MSGHCSFCDTWHSGSCCHPGRQLLSQVEQERDEAQLAAAQWRDQLAAERVQHTITKGDLMAADVERKNLASQLADSGISGAITRLRDIGETHQRGGSVPNLAEQIWDQCDLLSSALSLSKETR